MPLRHERGDRHSRAPSGESAIIRCARGDLPANVALMQAALVASEASDVERALRAAYDHLLRQRAVAEAARIGRAIELWNRMPEAFALVKEVSGIADHGARAATPEQHIDRWAKAFDAAADISPEASVALYSLGDPGVLDAITNDVVQRMREWGLLAPDREILEIGCGIGRFVRRLAPSVRTVVGVDISRRMIDTARERCTDLANATFIRASGHDLSTFADGSFDLVLAVDTFPYLTESSGDLAVACLREAARVLNPRGCILVLNWSYRGDLNADRADAERLAGRIGLIARRSGTLDFALWDGATFLFERARNAP